MNKEDDGGKGMQIVAVMVMAMAALTGAVSQEITTIQDEASQEEMEYQELFATARSLESAENQILLREEILITEASSQTSLITALSEEQVSIEQKSSTAEEEEFRKDALRAEIDAFYLHGSDLLFMDWSQGMLLQSCYSGGSNSVGSISLLHPQCRAEIVEFSGVDEVSDAIQISFTWDSQSGEESLSHMASFLPLIAEEYDGQFRPYITSCEYWTNCIQIQFPMFPDEALDDGPSYDTGWGAIYKNLGFSHYVEALRQDISWTKANIEFLHNEVDIIGENRDLYYLQWEEHNQNFKHYEQIGYIYDSVGETETRDIFWGLADELVDSMNLNYSLYIENHNEMANIWPPISENKSTLDSLESELIYQDTWLAEKEGQLQTKISEIKSEIDTREELESRQSQIATELSIANEMKRGLIADTLAYQMGFISLDDGTFSSSDSRTEFEDSIHNVSKSKYEEAKEVQEDAVEIREGLESTTQSIMFVSGGNVLFGACGGMLREKRMGYKGGSDRNALMVFGAGILSSVMGLFLYLF